MGSLEVFVANATNVPNVETFGKSDPYVNVEFQGEFFIVVSTCSKHMHAAKLFPSLQSFDKFIFHENVTLMQLPIICPSAISIKYLV